MQRRDFVRTLATALAAAASRARVGAQSRSYDFIIVGAGASGCVLANRLSADEKTRVVLIEAGGPASGDESLRIPGRWVSLLGSRWDWGYRTEPESTLNGRAIRWPRGKTLGGSTAINAMAYVRGHRACFDEWARAAGPAWSFAAVEPYFERVEAGLAISETRDPHEGHIAFLAAARELRFDADPGWDFNGARQENAAGFYRKTIRQGQRHSAADAFLTPALKRPNLTVLANTLASRITFERNRATGVEVLREGRLEQLRAERAIVLSAGVIETPKLLMLSGIGPPHALQPLGIRLIADSPAVGTHLQDHPRVSVRWKSRRPLAASSTSAGLFVRSGVAAKGSSGSETGRESLPPPDLQFYVGRGLDAPDDFVALTVALAQPRSRGTLTLRSADPPVAPIIRPRYFAEPADLVALADGVRLARELAATRAYADVLGEPVDPPDAAPSNAAIAEFIHRSADTIFHPVGTCRMGNAPDAVVDGELRVRGVEGLRVADGSVMPTVVNSQTQAACLMIAERAAEFLRASSE